MIYRETVGPLEARQVPEEFTMSFRKTVAAFLLSTTIPLAANAEAPSVELRNSFAALLGKRIDKAQEACRDCDRRATSSEVGPFIDSFKDEVKTAFVLTRAEFMVEIPSGLESARFAQAVIDERLMAHMRGLVAKEKALKAARPPPPPK